MRNWVKVWLICCVPFQAFALDADFSVSKVDPSGGVTPIPLLVSQPALSADHNQPCRLIYFVDPALRGAAVDHYFKDGDADVLIQDQVQVCARSKNVVLSIFVQKEQGLEKLHYVIDQLSSTPLIWLDPTCKSEGVHAVGTLSGEQTYARISCARDVSAKRKTAKLKFAIADSERTTFRYEPKTTRSIPFKKTVNLVQVNAEGEQTGKIELIWDPDRSDSTEVAVGSKAEIAPTTSPIQAEGPSGESKLAPAQGDVYLGLSYHNIQNHFLSGSRSDESRSGAQAKIMLEGYLPTRVWNDLIVHANFQADLFDSVLPQELRFVVTAQKKLGTFEDHSKLFFGLGASALAFTDSKNYNVLQRGLSPQLELRYETTAQWETTLSYSPFVGHSFSFGSASTVLLTDFKVHAFEREFKLGFQADIVSIEAAVSGSALNESVYGFAAMVGMAF